MDEMSYKIYKHLSVLKQEDLIISLTDMLKRFYKTVVSTPKYVYAHGEIPVALVAHMDTVHKLPPTDIYFDREEQVIWCPQGLGADDRAGIYSILSIINRGRRPHIIFTTDEEIGGLGAQALVRDCVDSPFDNLCYVIELDRRGQNDCVFYDCGNKNFQSKIEEYGFKTAIGSFSDICYICEAWDVAGVNLSIGYLKEHTTGELLHVDWMEDVVNRVTLILDEVDEDVVYAYEGVYVPISSGYGNKHANYWQYGGADDWGNYDWKSNNQYPKSKQKSYPPVKSATPGANRKFHNNNIRKCDICDISSSLVTEVDMEDEGRVYLMCKNCQNVVGAKTCTKCKATFAADGVTPDLCILCESEIKRQVVN